VLKNHGTVVVLLLIAICIASCGSSPGPRPGDRIATSAGGSPARALPAEYRVNVGDQLSILVLEQGDLSGNVIVRPDGMISPPAVGDLYAAGHTVTEVTAEITSNLKRLIRYPEVSVSLSDFADHKIYVFGEVLVPGAHEYDPRMTALHALGVAGGVRTSGSLSGALVLRRTGPSDLDVYRIDLEAAVDGHEMARDIFLQPYDIVFIPRSLIGEINLFVDQFIRQNIAPFTAYIEGWRAFNIEDWNSYDNR
jgi:protein involved in polysaccharide export with SLBB domain